VVNLGQVLLTLSDCILAERLVLCSRSSMNGLLDAGVSSCIILKLLLFFLWLFSKVPENVV
jgi:hypothetical protein